MGPTPNHVEEEYGLKEYWGMKFNWTPEHPTAADLEKHKFTYDMVAHEALEKLDELAPPPYANAPPEKGNIEGAIKPDGEKKKTRDLYELLRIHADSDEKIGRLWRKIHTVPDWVDWEQIERGQKIYFRYGGPAITSVSHLLRHLLDTPWEREEKTRKKTERNQTETDTSMRHLHHNSFCFFPYWAVSVPRE